jgi:hypothetical protein
LRNGRALAARAAMLHCGVHGASRSLRADCPRTSGAVTAELLKWERAASAARFGGCARSRSLLAIRLSSRCSDLLCSSESCAEYTIGLCVARLAAESRTQRQGRQVVGSAAELTVAALRERCEVWVRRLPPGLGPVCDALTGYCQTPPDAHPGAVLWPSVDCLERGAARNVQGTRAMCAISDGGARLIVPRVATPTATAHCMPCIVRAKKR